MTSGAIVMENGDWVKFETLTKAIVKPLQDAITGLQGEVSSLRTELKTDIKELPCSDHTIKLTQMETRYTNGQEYRKETQTIKKDSKDFVFKTLTVVGSIILASGLILGFLYKVGFFKALAK